MTGRRLDAKMRFLIIGLGNTIIDFVVLLVCSVALGLPIIPSNFISTTAGMAFSFLGNKSFVFKPARGRLSEQIGLFLAITVVGLWGLQPAIISIGIQLLEPTSLNQPSKVFFLKVMATAVTLVWNYLGYKHLAFRSRPHGQSKNR